MAGFKKFKNKSKKFLLKSTKSSRRIRFNIQDFFEEDRREARKLKPRLR